MRHSRVKCGFDRGMFPTFCMERHNPFTPPSFAPTWVVSTIESAFSLLKRGIIGSWHKVSAKHLSAYLAEMEFRFNRRKRSDLFIDTLRHMVTANPLTFENLTAA
jgi:hypothetical protein